MSGPLGYLAPRDLKAGSNACSPRTSASCWGCRFPLHRLLGEVWREKEEKEAAWLPCPAVAAPARALRATSAGAGGTGL